MTIDRDIAACVHVEGKGAAYGDDTHIKSRAK